MEIQDHSLKSIMTNAETYVETRIEILRLKFVDKASEALSAVTTGLSIFVVLAFGVFAVSIGLALMLGDLLGKSWYGFFVVGGVYAIAGILMYVNRKKWLKSRFDDLFVRVLLNG